MKKIDFFLLLFSILIGQSLLPVFAQEAAPGFIWQKTIGGNDEDVMTAMVADRNKTFVVCGYSKSNKSGNKTEDSFGDYDYWVVKMEAEDGKIVWAKTFGGNKNDYASAVIGTRDGGYLVGGTSVSDKSGSKSDSSYWHSSDYWIIKLDAAGNKLWDKTIGGIFTDKLTSLAELPTGDLLVAGISYSDKSGDKNIDNIGAQSSGDYWTVILDKNGKMLTQRATGGGSQDYLTNVASAGNSSYYTAGYSYSLKTLGLKSQTTVGNCDFWVVRTKLTGEQVIDVTIGGDRSDYLSSMQVLPDSTLLLGGYSNSNPTSFKTASFLGGTDFWLVQMNPNGSLQWDKTFGGTGNDYLVSVQQTYDHGFLLGGYSNSNKGATKKEDSRGGYDYWIVRTDSVGNVLWDKTIGGAGDDKLAFAYELGKKNFILAGTSSSGLSGEKDTAIIGGSGKSDYWVMRLGYVDTLPSPIDTGVVVPPVDSSNGKSIYRLSVNPNPSVNNMLRFQYSSTDNETTPFVIYSYDGRKMLTFSYLAIKETQTQSVSVASLPRGVYYLTMYPRGKKVSRIFIKY